MSEPTYQAQGSPLERVVRARLTMKTLENIRISCGIATVAVAVVGVFAELWQGTVSAAMWAGLVIMWATPQVWRWWRARSNVEVARESGENRS